MGLLISAKYLFYYSPTFFSRYLNEVTRSFSSQLSLAFVFLILLMISSLTQETLLLSQVCYEWFEHFVNFLLYGPHNVDFLDF